MTFTHFKAGKDDSDRRLDRVLRNFLSGDNLSSLYKSLRKGLIKVNGKKCEGNFRLNEGDDIQIADFLLKESADKINKDSQNSAFNVEPSSFSITENTIFKNEYILILNKAYDLQVQPSSSSKGKSLSEIVQENYEKNHAGTSLSFKTGPLHRLDRKTTGLIAFSQNLKGARYFSENIKTHSIQKVYLAILEGNLKSTEIWEDFIEKNGNPNTETFHTVTVNSEKGKLAHTEVSPAAHGVINGKTVTLARLLIKTGRTHQIRSQASFHGFPLLGDTAYGGTKIDSKKFGQDFFLHAYELHFPKDNPLELPEQLIAPPPDAFEKLLKSFDFN